MRKVLAWVYIHYTCLFKNKSDNKSEELKKGIPIYMNNEKYGPF